MKVAPHPDNEAARLEALYATGLLDTAMESVLQNIVDLAGQICGTSIALISLIDQKRQWFKANHGLDGVTETPRDIAFCSHAILNTGLMEVADATLDPRFSDNPLVLDFPNIRHYAGVPLVMASGHALGTLCVIDSKPGNLTESQQKQLQQLASMVTALFESRYQQSRLVQQKLESAAQATKFFRETPAMLYSVNNEGRLIKVSNCWLETMGYEREEVLGRHNSDFLTEESRQFVVEKALPQFARDGCIRDMPFQMIKKKGAVIDVLLSSTMYFDAKGTNTHSIGIFTDVTARKQAEAALEIERERALVTLESIGDAVITTDAEGKIDYLNPVASVITGWHLAEAKGQALSDLFHVIDEITREPVGDALTRCREKDVDTNQYLHKILINRHGQEYGIRETVAPIRHHNGSVIGVVVVFHDVTEQRRLEREIVHQARHDSLTGLCNRYAFEQKLKSVLDSLETRPAEHALCYLDLDQFKLVNDTCGHEAGDQLLRQLSAVFDGKIRRTDTLARLGGDEFGVLLEKCNLKQAQRIANVLRQATEEFSFVWNEKRFRVGVSIGLVPVNRSDQTVADVLKAADSACYMAKDSGRNRVQLYQEQDQSVAARHDQMQWVSEVQHALDENRLILYSQPIITTGPQASTGLHCELLVRMKQSNGEIVLPGAFMAAAERYSLAVKIDRWVIANALRWFAAHPQVTAQLDMCAINLSGQSMSDQVFHAYVLKQLDETGVPPEKICFEITETAAVANLGEATRFMEVLKKRGCLFALDDFGSGLSSFGYLKSLPVDFLKIDGQFVKDIMDDPLDMALVRSINEIGHLLGKQTIAEYVESDAILERLREIGVDYAQGYSIGRPEPLENLKRFPALPPTTKLKKA